MAIYHLGFFAVNGRIIAVQRFSAETDGEALAIARAIVKVAPSEIAVFQLWQNRRRVHAGTRKAVPQRSEIRERREFPMRALVYFRHKGETTYRNLGFQEMKELPPKGSDVTVNVDGKLKRARVLDRRKFVSRRRERSRDLSLYLEGV